MVGRLAQLHFCPTAANRRNLEAEGVRDGLFVTGNTVIDALQTTVLKEFRFAEDVLNRLAKAGGHLNKVRSMVENGEDCSEVLVQLAAVKAALNNTGKIILKDHIEHCIVHAVEEGDARKIQELNEAIDKFMK